MKVKLETKNEKVYVSSYYNQSFVKGARDLGGSWDAKSRQWVFGEEYEDIVKKKLKRIFGTTGEGDYETCTLEISNYSKKVTLDAIYLFGRQIARAFDRDGGAKLGDDIVFIEGDYKSGGSRNYWATVIENGEFHIKNFPLDAALNWKKVKDACNEGWCKILLPVWKERKLKLEKLELDN